MLKATKSTRYAVRIFILALLLLMVVIIGFSCVEGLTPIGWSGGAVADNSLYVGTRQGRLVSVDLTDGSRLWGEKITAAASGGLFGCLPAGGSGCGGASGVAIYGTPAVGDELVYIAGYNGKVYAYARDTLAYRWVYPREGYFAAIAGGIVLAEGRLYFADSDGKIHALDAETGDYIWSFTGVEDKIWATPAYANGVIYIGSFDKKLYALNAADGTVKWTFTTEGTITATPLIVDGTIYVGSHDRHFYAISTDGTLKWRATGDNWFWAQPVLYEGRIYAGCLDGYVYVFDAATGSQLNRFNLEKPLSAAPVLYENTVIFATREGVVYAINTADGTMTQLAVLEGENIRTYGPLAINDGIVYIHTQDLELRRVNAENGAILGTISLSIGE